jgi:hypothetical protein
MLLVLEKSWSDGFTILHLNLTKMRDAVDLD